jgi:hypothetical protein
MSPGNPKVALMSPSVGRNTVTCATAVPAGPASMIARASDRVATSLRDALRWNLIIAPAARHSSSADDLPFSDDATWHSGKRPLFASS